MLDQMNILQPNYMGSELVNTGVEGIASNYGYGVSEVMKANPQVQEYQDKLMNPAMEKLRRHKAREFGLTKETVGF